MRFLSAIFLLFVLALGQAIPSPAEAQLFNRGARTLSIQGSGASFPFPLYSVWFRTYGAQRDGVNFNFQSTGSGAGIQAFTQRVVDFAASDSAMTDEQIARVDGGVLLLPMAAGEISLVYNLPGVPELRLPREVYPRIFSGEISRWNDPLIVAANPGVEMPDRPIIAVRRSDGSGTTFVFTQHLAAIHPEFADKIGVGTSVQWPSSFIGAPRNDGVTAQVSLNPGAIGYVEYGFARGANQPVALLENASGEFVAPGPEAGSAALSSADFDAEDLRIWVTDPNKPGAYPIATFTWMLFYREHGGNPRIAEELRGFVAWAMSEEGQQIAKDLNYVPLPPEAIARNLKEAENIR